MISWRWMLSWRELWVGVAWTQEEYCVLKDEDGEVIASRRQDKCGCVEKETAVWAMMVTESTGLPKVKIQMHRVTRVATCVIPGVLVQVSKTGIMMDEWIQREEVAMDSPPAGLYNKYNVARVDGRDRNGGDKENARYFVLDYVHDADARKVMRDYAEMVRHKKPELAVDLLRELEKTHDAKLN